MKIFITGITGLIGSHLAKSLLSKGHVVSGLTRNAQKASEQLPRSISLVESLEQADDFFPDVVINLAGEPIADHRWSESRKNKIKKSRIELTRDLVEWMSSLKQTPDLLISGSAVGYYGRQGAGQIDEDGAINDEFQHQLCRDWEKEALQAESICRVCLLRTGLVVAPNGGFLKKMLLPFKLGLGGRLGDGQQFMSWIHLDDMVAAIEYLIAHQTLAGPFNITAPHAVTNEVFTKTLASCLNRPAFFHVPSFVLKTMLGEMSDLLLTGQNVVPRKLIEAGFQFKHQELEDALKQACGKQV